MPGARAPTRLLDTSARRCLIARLLPLARDIRRAGAVALVLAWTAAALVAAATAIVLAARAAHGSLSAVAGLLLIASFGVRWYAPHESSAAQDGGASVRPATFKE